MSIRVRGAICAAVLVAAAALNACGGAAPTAPTAAASLVVTAILPKSGPSEGTTQVSIWGTHFQPGARVTFVSSAGLLAPTSADATDVSVANESVLTATTPAHALGLTDVVVTNPDGQSATYRSGFTFDHSAPPAPPLIKVSPELLSTGGGGTVVVHHPKIGGGAAVTVDGVA